MSAVTVWFSASSVQAKAELQCTIRMAEKIIGCRVPSLQDLYLGKEPTHFSRLFNGLHWHHLDPNTLAHSLAQLHFFCCVWRPTIYIYIVACCMLTLYVCTLYQGKFLVIIILISFSIVYSWPKCNLHCCGSSPPKDKVRFREEIAVLSFLMNIALYLLSLSNY